jgi:RNA polymerase sigma-70 factor (ECF subfamily)
MSDEQLLSAMADGQEFAMRLLFARHSARISRFVTRIIGDPATAEDIVNDVFIEAWRHASRFAARSSASTWLLAIARHKAISSSRRSADEQLDDDVALAPEDPAGNPEDTLFDHEQSTVLRRCLERLPPAMREVIDLVYYHRQSVAEVAEIVNAPEATVRTRMFYARKCLAQLLVEAGVRAADAAKPWTAV